MDSVDSAAAFNAEPAVKDAYEKGYGVSIGVTDTATNGMITYRIGCSVNAFAADVRRAAMNVQYNSVVSVASGVDIAAASQGVTDTASFASAVASVVASDAATYSSVIAPSASDITSVGTATAATIEGGTYAPTGGPSGDDEGIEMYIIVLLVVGGLVLIGAIVLLIVKIHFQDPDGAPTEDTTADDKPSSQLEMTTAGSDDAISADTAEADDKSFLDTVTGQLAASDSSAQGDHSSIGLSPDGAASSC